MPIEIERRIEARHEVPDYQGKKLTEAEIDKNRHRSYVGGRWDEMGEAQLKFLIDQGMTPEMTFLDVGCGSLRAGRHLVHYLDPGHYYGCDINAEVIEIGYERELDDDGKGRLPAGNLRMTDRFDCDFGVEFDMAIAQSVFTHVSLNHARLCLYRVAKVMKPGGKFFVTYRERPDNYPVDGTNAKSRDYTERNVFWHYRGDMRWVAKRSPWDFRYIGDWGHPRGLRMVEYTRNPD